MNQLKPNHLKMLCEESGISDAVIDARGYRSVTDHKELANLGFTPCQVPGLLLPVYAPDGSQPYCQYRPDRPRFDKNGKAIKYETPKGQGLRLDCLPSCRQKLGDPAVPLFITEGLKKADALASRGVCAVALMGVHAFKGKNAFGGVTFLADWDYIALSGRVVYIVFDSDVTIKDPVQKALARLNEHLKRKGADIHIIYLPMDGDQKIGVDNYLAAGHTIEDLKALAEGPRPEPQAVQPTIMLLDDAPLTLRRPLSLIDGVAYVAIWPYVRVEQKEALDENGNIVKLNPPHVTTEQRLMLVRQDGRIFGDGTVPLSDLRFQVKLHIIPSQHRLWQTRAIRAYVNGARPDPCDVFWRLVGVYDHYLDFSRSLESQKSMCCLSACTSLMTWFSEAFDVLPYPWPNGEFGCGKTKWGNVWVATSYLGQMLTLGGSFAALRDLADYGAAMLFDDAENVEDKNTDPDKKALLLSGNRRGMEVPLKEQNANRKWEIRWVNAYTPRAFTSKKKPFGALETRSLLIPLARTADSQKGNRDPIRLEGWPTPHQALQDDLWATALRLLSEAKACWAELDAETSLVGRQFEVWRAPLAVARLFEKYGVEGLEGTIRTILSASMEEKQEELSDHTTLVVRAIAAFCFGVSDISDVSDKSDILRERVSATEIADKVKELAEAGEETEWATPKSIGWIFSSLRLPKEIDTSTKKKTRYRKVDEDLIFDLLCSYNLRSLIPSIVQLETSETSDPPKNSNQDIQPQPARGEGSGVTKAPESGTLKIKKTSNGTVSGTMSGTSEMSETSDSFKPKSNGFGNYPGAESSASNAGNASSAYAYEEAARPMEQEQRAAMWEVGANEDDEVIFEEANQ